MATDYSAIANAMYGSPAPASDNTALTAGGIAEPPPQATPGGPERFYPDANQVEAHTPAELKPSTPEELAAALHPEAKTVAIEIPENIKALRDADPARKLFADTGLESALPESLFTDAEGITPEVKTAVVKEMRAMCQDVGLGHADVQEFVTLSQQMAKAPPSAEQITQWQGEAADLLIAEYGKEGARRALDDAKALVQRDPRVAKLLDANGLGNRPEVVLRFARLARMQRR